jgi:hypothetical protein
MKNGVQMYERFPPPHASTTQLSIVRPRMFNASYRCPKPQSASPSTNFRFNNSSGDSVTMTLTWLVSASG